MSEKPVDEEALFHAARRIADPAARAPFIDQACGDNAALAERVRVLLNMHEPEDVSAESPTRTAAFEPVTERPGSRVGPYVLREQIGEGGFGLVFVAEQQEPVKRKVALKVIKPGMDSQQVIARFEAERQALALMDHPNIARVLDAGATESGRPYFVMELVAASRSQITAIRTSSRPKNAWIFSSPSAMRFSMHTRKGSSTATSNHRTCW